MAPSRLLRVLTGRRALIALAAFAVVVALAFALSFVLDEPLRRTVERQMNAKLTGYTVSIGGLSFHPVGLSLTLRELVFAQTAHPDPPLARIPRLEASVQWRALLSAKLVASFNLDRPQLHVDLEHLRKEAEDPQPVTDKGWQEAFQAVYPLKINHFKIVEGAVTYVDVPPAEPLELSRLNVTADNIRNVRSQPGDYPSPIHAEALVFKTGTAVIDGHADFLATPHLGMKANVTLDGIDLNRFTAITNRYHVSVKNGVLAARGLVEYAPTIKAVELDNATINNVQVEYTHTPAQTGVVKKATAETARKAKQVSDEPDLRLRAKELRVVDSTFGFVNRAASPGYRVFISNTNLTVTNFSNHGDDGRTKAELTGKFMGSGATVATATFLANPKGPDFDLNVRIEDTDMRTMNDLLRSSGKFDVSAGAFSVYSEMSVRNQHIDGYVKPLFKDLDVYNPEQDRDKSALKKLYERTVEGVSKVLKNVPRKEVATVVRLSGPVENPGSNILEILAKLIQNAFFKAILPGFDREVAGLRGSRGGS